MRHEDFEMEGYKIVVTYHEEESELLQEAKASGKPLIGTYSVKKHQPHVPGCDYHLHVYDGSNEIFAINQNGSAHDGYHGVRIPNKVYKELQKQYKNWVLPPDQIIEGVQFTYFLEPIESLNYRQVMTESDVIFGELSRMEMFEKHKSSYGLLTEAQQSIIIKSIEEIRTRWQNLFSELAKRI